MHFDMALLPKEVAKCITLHSKKMVLYSTKSGSLARNHRGTTLGASVVLQRFFSGSLARNHRGTTVGAV